MIVGLDALVQLDQRGGVERAEILAVELPENAVRGTVGADDG